MIDAWAAGGLAVTGPEATFDALVKGQVEELLITARPDALRRINSLPPDSPPGPIEVDTTAATELRSTRTASSWQESWLARAQQNAARTRFIEDPALLEGVGGVGAILRFRI